MLLPGLRGGLEAVCTGGRGRMHGREGEDAREGGGGCTGGRGRMHGREGEDAREMETMVIGECVIEPDDIIS